MLLRDKVFPIREKSSQVPQSPGNWLLSETWLQNEFESCYS